MGGCEYRGLYFANRLFRLHAEDLTGEKRMWKGLWISYAREASGKRCVVVMTGDKKCTVAARCRL